MSKQQQLEFAESVLSFSVGTGKDAQIYIKFKKINEDGTTSYYNVPLVTLSSIQVFSSKPKMPRFVFGSADPVALSHGVRQVRGFVVSTVLNESVGMYLRKAIQNYQPISAAEAELDENGYISLNELDELRHLDQLPPVDINIFITNPTTGQVFSKAIYGVMFNEENYSIGSGATMGETFSFLAQEVGELQHQKISKAVETSV